MKKSYKVRLYPTKEQDKLMREHIGACRFIWNWALETQNNKYSEDKTCFSCSELIKQLPKLKKDKEYLWLNNISSCSLQTTIRDLDKAYKDFFRGVHGFPKFKTKKKSKMSFPIINNKTYFENNLVTLPKIGKMLYKTNLVVPNKNEKIYNPRVSFANNKWILSYTIESESKAIGQLNGNMGIDLGIKVLCNVAFEQENIVFENINKTQRIKRQEKQLKRLQRKVGRKYAKHNNYEKTKNILCLENKIKEKYFHISNIRKDYIHKITKFLVSQKPKRIVMEDLGTIGMMKNHRLARAIQEQCFYEFKRQMEYKCKWNGIEFVLADRFYPSSKTCSCCGNVKKDLKLRERTYVCSQCGLIIDRDYNAAINLMNYVK